MRKRGVKVRVIRVHVNNYANLWNWYVYKDVYICRCMCVGVCVCVCVCVCACAFVFVCV